MDEVEKAPIPDVQPRHVADRDRGAKIPLFRPERNEREAWRLAGLDVDNDDDWRLLVGILRSVVDRGRSAQAWRATRAKIVVAAITGGVGAVAVLLVNLMPDGWKWLLSRLGG